MHTQASTGAVLYCTEALRQKKKKAIQKQVSEDTCFGGTTVPIWHYESTAMQASALTHDEVS